jgi:predicted phage terminase large subunit-like protein
MTSNKSTRKKPSLELTGEVVKGFTESLLLSRYDSPQPVPWFHTEMWDLCCDWKKKNVAISAPRAHAKSTAITHAYLLACILFRIKKFVLLLSDTEGQAIQFLGDIKKELEENEQLINLFQIKGFVKDTEADVIVAFKDGHEVRIIAKGSEQKIRGTKWRNKRPDLILGDDLENDEIVLNDQRRDKFKTWFLNAVLPSLSDDGHIRIVGTILHLDSFLSNLMPNPEDKATINEPLKVSQTNKKRAWQSVLYRAHPGMQDFTHILWQDKWPEERLREVRQVYLDEGRGEGYAQEFLNCPIDEETAYFRKQDVKPLTASPGDVNEEYYAGIDMAISEKKQRAYTVIAVVGVDEYGVVRTREIVRFRGDGLEIINTMFAIQTRYKPELFIVEQENIARSLGPFLNKEQVNRGIYLNLEKLTPTQDPIKRCRSLQARMRAGGWEFDHDASWFPGLQQELLFFPRGQYSDQVMALAWIGLVLDQLIEAPTKREAQEWQEEQEYHQQVADFGWSVGRSSITGY